jgi:sugar phosphate permease
VATSGTPAAFAINGLSFFVAAACVLPVLGRAEPPRAAGQRSNAWRDLREGIGLVLRVPWLWITIAVFSLVNITISGPRAVALPFLVERNLHASVGTLGFLYSAGAAGAVLGTLWLGGRQRLRRRGPLAYGATVLSGLAALVIGLAPLVAVVSVASFVIGLCISVFSLIWTNTLQELVPRDKLGRVASIDGLGSFVLLPLGFGLTGWATDRLGAPAVFVVGGAATALLALAAWLHPAIRSLD